jgi:hypothetical protein
MPETKPSPSPMPLFFNQIVGVDPKLHGNLRLDPNAGFGFAADAQFVPLGLGEFEAASHDYPIVFTADPQPAAIALLGLMPGQNLFLQSDGSWRSEAYIPAYLRAFPFVFAKSNTSTDLFLGMDPGAACLSKDKGEPLFDREKPSKVLTDAIALTGALRGNLLAAEELAHALDQAGVLELEEAKIDFAAGGQTMVRGFKVLKRDRLDKLADATFLDWRRRQWLPALYAHVSSTDRWMRLIEAAAKMRSRSAH